MTYQEERDQRIVEEALLFGGVCAVVVIGVVAFAYWLIKNS